MGRKPASVVLCLMLAIRTTEDRLHAQARSMTAVSTTLRTPEGALVLIATGRAGSSWWPGGPAFPDRANAPRRDQRVSVPRVPSPYAIMTGSSAADTASIPPKRSRFFLCATWILRRVRGRLHELGEIFEVPRRTFAPSADTAAAAVPDRARPVTSMPAALSSV